MQTHVGVVLAVMLGTAVAAFAETGIVVSSGAAAYPVGMALEDETIVVLAGGESLAVLTQSGRGIKLSGPFDGPLPDADVLVERLVDKLGAAVLGDDEGETVIGAVRGPPPLDYGEEETNAD
ncbi:hypothetical protein JYU02_00950 [bacterium AH-315-P15]|nr:hypothetical protein [bacterium AH-315-P15]